MEIHFGTQTNYEKRMNYWFSYIYEVCKKTKCDECPFVGGAGVVTSDINSTLFCVTGAMKKPRYKNESGTGNKTEQGNQTTDAQSQE